ncbi:MAG TPA: hypothetical protein VHB02_18255 [Acidimicrobiales bacterium]|nr:hypothetical protein [Acidimicrobiales bacterium]
MAASTVALTAGAAGAAGNGNGPGQSGRHPAVAPAPASTPPQVSSGPLDVSSAALAPTSDVTFDVAGPVNSSANPPSASTTTALPTVTLTTSTYYEINGSAIAPDGESALLSTDTGLVAVVNSPLTTPSVAAPINLSKFTGEGGPTYNAFSYSVAITPEGQTALVSLDSQGVAALTHASGSWAVDTGVQSPGTNQAGDPHQPGWVRAPTTTATPTTTTNTTLYDSVVISRTTGADGHYVGLALDQDDEAVAAITGVGTSGVKFAGVLADPGVGGALGDRGNGGMAFSPTTATKAVVPTADGFEGIDLSDPAHPAVVSKTDIPGAATTAGASSVAVAPDGDHVVVAVGDTLYFYGGLSTAAASSPLQQSADPLTLPGIVASLEYTASGNLVVEYATGATATTQLHLAIVSGSTTTSPTRGTPYTLSGVSDAANAMSVVPQVAAINHGYWEVASDGGLFAFGSAQFYGSMGGKPLNQPVVGMTSTADKEGYYEVASDGGLFAFGDAAFYGSMGGKPLNQPVVGMTLTPTGKGYWEVASDGGLFAFGDAQFYGSMGGKPLNKPVVGIAATPDGKGYWEVASDGGLFAFGDAQFYGSMGGKPLNKPVVGIAAAS